ncbi:MAG: hypothetical protein FLDDKLPJ_03354 [Phycisphaerae bacterium]|nr:hypothetical protein [Phycisphaerae bacterium]
MAGSKPLRIPSYRLHKPTGRAVVRLNGRDIYLGTHGTPASHAEYQRVIAEWISRGGHYASLVQPTGSASNNGHTLSIDELILAYMEHAKAYYVKNGEPTGEVQNIREALRPLTTSYGRLSVDQFGPTALKVVRQAMIEAGWCRNHINAQVHRIRRVFRWAVENELAPPSTLHGLLSVSPLKRGRCNVRESSPVTPVPERLIEPVLNLVPPPIAAMIRLQLLTGMRPGEVMSIRTCDVDTSAKLWAYRPATHKTEHHGRNRVIYLGPKAQQALQPFLRADREAFVFSPAFAMEALWRNRRAERRTPMTPSQASRTRKARPEWKPGDAYDRRSYAWAIYRACDRAFPPPDDLNEEERRQWRRDHRWSPNQLRHNAATRLRRDFGLEAARVVLGHSSADVTEIYAELDFAKAASVMEQVG